MTWPRPSICWGGGRSALRRADSVYRCDERLFVECLDALALGRAGEHGSVAEACADGRALTAILSSATAARLLSEVPGAWEDLCGHGDATAAALAAVPAETATRLVGWDAYLAKRAAVLAGRDPAPVPSLDALASDADAMGAVAGSEAAMALLALSGAACAAILSRACAVGAVVASAPAREALSASGAWASAVEGCEGAVERADNTSGQGTWVGLGAPTPVEGPGAYVLGATWRVSTSHASSFYGRYSAPSSGGDVHVASYGMNETGFRPAWAPLYRANGAGAVSVMRSGGPSGATGFSLYYVDMEEGA